MIDLDAGISTYLIDSRGDRILATLSRRPNDGGTVELVTEVSFAYYGRDMAELARRVRESQATWPDYERGRFAEVR